MEDKEKLVGSFLGGWIATNVHAEGRKADGDLAGASGLAARCVALAAGQGLTRADFEARVGDLDQHMRHAQNIAQDLVDALARTPPGRTP